MELTTRNRKRATNGESAIANPIERFRHEFDDLLGRFFGEPAAVPHTGMMNIFGPTTFPQIDIVESDDKITVRAEVPGMKPEDVHIDVTGNILTLRGEKKAEREEKKKDYRYSERQYGSFARSIQLPSSVDAAKVDATYKDGVLNIALERKPEAKPRRITVRNA